MVFPLEYQALGLHRWILNLSCSFVPSTPKTIKYALQWFLCLADHLDWTRLACSGSVGRTGLGIRPRLARWLACF